MAGLSHIIATRGLKRALDHWRERRQLESELASLTPEQRAEMEADLRLKAGDMQALLDGSHEHNELQQVLRKLGRTLAELQREKPDLAATLKRECAMCSAWTRCASDLEDQVPGPAVPSYCPNLPGFSEVAPRGG